MSCASAATTVTDTAFVAVRVYCCEVCAPGVSMTETTPPPNGEDAIASEAAASVPSRVAPDAPR
jgi:hypothetical protein